MELGPEARLFHLGDDLLRRHLRFVVDDGHALRHQIHIAALYPRQPPGHFFHGRAACGAVHPGNVIYFFPHGGSSFETVNCFPVDLSQNRHSYFVCIIYPHGVFVKQKNNADRQAHPRRFLFRSPALLQAQVTL